MVTLWLNHIGIFCQFVRILEMTNHIRENILGSQTDMPLKEHGMIADSFWLLFLYLFEAFRAESWLEWCLRLATQNGTWKCNVLHLLSPPSVVQPHPHTHLAMCTRRHDCTGRPPPWPLSATDAWSLSENPLVRGGRITHPRPFTLYSLPSWLSKVGCSI